MNYLQSVDWEKYLEREQDFFLFAAFIRPYGQLLHKTVGFQFTHQLQKYSETLGIFYRSHKELQACDQHFVNVIHTNKEQILSWLDHEEKLFQRFSSFSSSDPQKILSFFEQILLYNTVIPYRLFSALLLKKKVDPQLQKKLEYIRSRSLYQLFYNRHVIPLLHCAASVLSIDTSLASFLTPSELLAVLSSSKKIKKQELEKRTSCWFYLSGNSIQFYFGTLPSLDEKIQKNISIFHGKCAYPGKAKGIVTLVNNLGQLQKFKKGNILVSINTNPSLMPAIEKARAIITDEGGLLCHAAIVSRELKIPCVIGTKIATKILKDGDTVIIDAEKGIVEKIH